MNINIIYTRRPKGRVPGTVIRKQQQIKYMFSICYLTAFTDITDMQQNIY